MKIDPDDYYLSYSGGKDSHFLLWFIREYLKEDRIPIVGVNTGAEIPEIRRRIVNNSDIVLFPVKHRNEIKEKYGIPCFSKQQDEYIKRYQNGSRSANTMRAVNGENVKFNLNKKARTLLLGGKLHKISNACCRYSKDDSMRKWGNENGRRAIMGVRGDESATRKSKYGSCLKKNGDFSPLYDFTSDVMDLIYKCYEIEIPECYNYLSRTGCAGCPYGRNTETELSLLPELQREKTIEYFKESYDVLGVNYKNIQQTFYSNVR